MDQKTKNVVVFAVVLVFSVAIIAYTLKMRKGSQQVYQTGQSTQQDQSKPQQKEEPKTFSTVFLEGEITGFKDGKLGVKNGDVQNDILLAENLFVFEKNGDEIVKKEDKALKKGTQVRLEINKENSEAIAAEVLRSK